MSKAKLSASEWELVKDAPFWVNRALSAADGRVAFFAKRREGKALEKAMEEYKGGNALIKDIVADDGDPDKAIEKASEQDALQALTRIANIVSQKLGDDDLNALSAFLVAAGRAVASASREGGMGVGKSISDKEEAALKEIEGALKTKSSYAQVKPAPKPAESAAQPAPKPAAGSAKPAPAPAKRDDDARKKEEQEKNLAEARERQEKARQEAEAKAEARKEAEAKERLEQARKEAEERQREAAAEREAKAKAEAEAAAAREEAARKEAEAKAAASAPKYTEFIAEHTVQPGDNLSFISQRYYGHQGNFRIIYEANKDVIGDNMNLIRPGQVLKIPKL